MADALKVLGQSAPSANTDTTLYTVPGSTSAAGSSIIVCNRSTAATFRIAVRPAGAAIANQHYLFYDAPIAANATVSAVVGFTLATTDVITVRASTANLSFSVFGIEVT
jgi:hypothetical protein